MNADADHSRLQLRWSVYLLLIAMAAGSMTGRILAVNSVDLTKLQAYRISTELAKSRQRLAAEGFRGDELAEKLGRRELELRERLRLERPFLSGNDRSRWCTVRALVEDGTYAIEQYVTDPLERPRWNTIDMVKHDRSGQPHLYSSKPTLLPTLLAGEYWLVRKLTGWTLKDQPHQVVRLMLVTVNVGSMIVFFVLLAGLVERFGTTDWGRLLVMASATFGTLLSTFSVALNNHLIAAVSAMIALYAAVKIWYDERRTPWWFVVAGFFAAFTAASELPALAFLAMLGAGLLWKAPKPTLLYGLPAAAVVIAAALGTNYAAHKTILPPYYHREAGKDWQTGNWYNYTYRVGDREIDSYWKRDEQSVARRSKIDQGEPSRIRYAVHCLIGHRGILSLTPIWVLTVLGVAWMMRDKGRPSLRPLGWLIAITTVICLAFYLLQDVENRNYGGTTSGLRWMFWFAPMWLVGMLPAADWTAQRRTRRVVAAVLLAASVMSASYPTWNPWSHPWIARWLDYLNWIEL